MCPFILMPESNETRVLVQLDGLRWERDYGTNGTPFGLKYSQTGDCDNQQNFTVCIGVAK